MMNRPTFTKNAQFLMLMFIFVCSFTVGVSAQQNKSKDRVQHQKDTKSLAQEQIELAERLIKSTQEYKSSLEKLSQLYQLEIDKNVEKLEKKKELYQLGIVARREVENLEQEVTNSRNKFAELEKDLVEADYLLVEAEAAKEQAKTPQIATTSSYKVMSGVIRYTGTTSWFLQDTPVLQKFFQDSFNRALPISAYGQSNTHDRLGYDHRNSIDIALHPESTEGQALITFLRNKGIPFQAFNHAIAGSSTGPHIHIGKPSVRFR